MKTPKQNQNPPSFYYYCEESGHWKEHCYKFKRFGCLQPSNQPFRRPPNSQWQGSEELQGLFPILSTSLEKHFSRLRRSLLQSWHWSHTLHPTTVKQPPPQRTETVQIVGLSNDPQEVPVSERVPFCLGPLRVRHFFSPSVPPPLFIY